MTTRLPASVLLVTALGATLLAGCGPSEEEAAASRAAAIEVVEQFGTRLVHVDLTVQDRQQLTNDVRDTYGPYVTTLLLSGWMSDLTVAPGRETSSPWPARIDVRDATPISRHGYDVTGDIVYVTAVDGDPVLRTPIRAKVLLGPDDIWRISEWSYE